ncbi:hypothetical protein EDB81DRAFT_791284 [Dactylonectria macrodidyma]|uniref:BZIP transcription factor n=1 Tax=Dactylonectria macrodidyma TaxID=307937 RepID=A0A9P9F495_9HYPO|nr:hypothetical protein EDB81DRAFT_791284 [Dactylonectria macrodidyma]
MPKSPTPVAPRRRVRTEAQLNQKRKADRVKHKENREEHKLRMERMEADISQIFKNLDDISAQLRALPQLGAGFVASQQRWLQFLISNMGIDASAVSGEAHDIGFLVRNPAIPTQWSPGSLARNFSPRPLHPDIEQPLPAPQTTLLPAVLPSLPPVKCWCGVEHFSQSNCLEYRSFTILYETHVAFPHDPHQARSLPRNPSLPNLTLHSHGDNVVTCFLTSFLKGFTMTSVETLFGVYFFAYRLMRWRLYPDPITLQHVPSWLLPTKVQDTCPHPVSIDYIPWPDLRDFLCTRPMIESRHSVKLYLESLQLRWPVGCPLLAVNSEGLVDVSPEFEAAVFDLRNWSLSSAWADMFPRLVSLIHP